MKESHVEEYKIYLKPTDVGLEHACQNLFKNNFMIISNHWSNLRFYIKSLLWNCVKKTITIEINETKDLSAYRWFSQINERDRESKKTPFMDDRDNLELILFDENNNQISRFELSGLELKSHECSLGNNKWDLGFSMFGTEENNPLIHEIVIEYKTMKDVPVSFGYEEIDEEWKKDVIMT